MRYQRCILKSGSTGSQAPLQSIYIDFEEFESYNEIFGLAQRLGYKTALTAWNKNPIVQSGTNPADCRKVTPKQAETANKAYKQKQTRMYRKYFA